MTEPHYSAWDVLRLPDWGPSVATWTAWPSDAKEWGADLSSARRAVIQMCGALAPDRVQMLVLPGESEESARAALGDSVVFHSIAFGDIWLRDTGPLFVTSASGLGAVCGRWNGWGGKYLFEHDDQVGARIAGAAGAELFRHPHVIEGGAVDVDGAGIAVTTRQCVLNRNRNPDLDEASATAVLRGLLGVDRVVWLGDGLAADHTDGHVDNLARFVAPNHAVCMEPSGPGDPNRAVLQAAARDLTAAGLEVSRIPSPGAVYDSKGALMAASYLNFCVGNHVVIVPVFGAPADDRATAAIAALFPDRGAIPIDARGLLTGGGTFHCITQQQPRIDHDD